MTNNKQKYIEIIEHQQLVIEQLLTSLKTLTELLTESEISDE